MRYFATTLIMLMMSITSITAQSYSTLWKQVGTATDKDQPQTAVGLLRNISAKAEKEHRYGDLFAALYYEIQKQAEISEDSVMPAARRLFSMEEKLRRQGKGVVDCVLRTSLYLQRGLIYDDSLRQVAETMRPDVDSLLKSPDAAQYIKSNTTSAYSPFVEKEVGSKYFNHDLLSLIGIETGQYDALKKYYQSIGNAKAEALIDVITYPNRNFKNTKAKVEWLDSMLVRWGNWEGVNTLHNDRLSLSYPTVSSHLGSSMFHTFDSIHVYFHEIRNIKEATVTITRKGTNETTTWHKKFAEHADYEEFSDTLEIGCLPLGEYEVSMTTTPNTSISEKQSLYVSDLMILTQAQPGSIVKYVVVDAKSGNPVPKAKLHFFKTNKKKEEIVVETDENAEYKSNNRDYTSAKVSATTDTDQAMLAASTSNWYRYYAAQKDRKLCNVFTDRRIYRPGQIVKVSALAYEVENGTETSVRQNCDMTLRLLDPKHKIVDKKTVKTNGYGMASVEFTLPSNGTNGMYTVASEDGTATISVEEYVRPTFDVTIDSPKTAYHLGDTLNVKGSAKMYSGVAVAGAKVVYSVTRARPLWWIPYFRGGNYDNNYGSGNSVILVDTAYTQSDGSFTIKMPMTMDKQNDRYVPRFVSITADVTVTDVAGESHHASISLPVCNRESVLTTDLPSKSLADSTVYYSINRMNNVGNNIDGKVKLSIDGKDYGVVNANEKISLPLALSSGSHNLTAICEKDTLVRDFVIFRLTDEHPVVKTHDWFYQTSQKFPEDGGDVVLQFGSSDRNSYAVYSVFKENTILESGNVRFDSALVTRHLTYKEEYGDGIIYTIAWAHDGQVYSHKAEIRRPLPSKALKLEWSSFRNLVEPGQKEQWSLRIKNADGTPSHAVLTATLFDKSLDAIVKHNWFMNDPRYISLPMTDWHAVRWYQNIAFYGNDFSGLNQYKALSFSHFNEEYTPGSPIAYNINSITRAGGRRLLMAKSARVMNESASLDMVTENVMLASAPVEGSFEEVDVATEQTETEESVSVRENLSELAAFFPCAETDANGIVKLTFTLPESVTTWRFMGLAHDKGMAFGTLDDEVVAQKKLMVQPRVPRFLRETDTTVIPATVSNLSDKDLKAKVTMTILDQETEQVLSCLYNKVEVKKGETAVTEFPLDASKYGERTLVVRVTAEAENVKGKSLGYSDGEQHLLPVLSSKEEVINTLPLVLTEKGVTNVNVEEMLPDDVKDGTLNVDYTDSPAWLLLKSLPYIKGTVDDNAISLVTAYYTNTLASRMLKSNPNGADLLTSDDAEKATLYDPAAMEYRARNILTRLSTLQLSDGSWPWWKGMDGSLYMTMEVTKTLLRLNHMLGVQSNTVALLDRAYNYLDNEAEREIKEMKKLKKKGGEPWISGWLLDYLYCQSLASRTKNVSYLLDVMRSSITGKGSRYTDMSTKAEATVVLAMQGLGKEAAEQVESIVQHTVYRNDIGRYFDSYRAGYSWCDYRIPTQVSAIEALRTATPLRKSDIIEMQRWLLSSKRTQSWDTPINAVNAVYAFFGGDASELKPGTPAGFRLDGKVLAQNSNAKSNKNVSNAGFTSAETAVNQSNKQLSINKTTDTESWASVSVKFLQEQKNIASSESGFKVKRTIALSSDVKTNGFVNKTNDIALQNDSFYSVNCKVGDKVTVTISITADRDYDFVTVVDNRASCLEPINQLSGYHSGAYTVQHDTNTEYCFDMFRKGTHTITTEYYVTRPGCYTAGTVDVKCTYATEFTGRTAAKEIKVTK